MGEFVKGGSDGVEEGESRSNEVPQLKTIAPVLTVFSLELGYEEIPALSTTSEQNNFFDR